MAVSFRLLCRLLGAGFLGVVGVRGVSEFKLIICDACRQLAQHQIIWKDINKLNTLLCNDCLEIMKSTGEIMTKKVKKINENVDFDKEFFDYCEKLVPGAYQKIWSKK